MWFISRKALLLLIINLILFGFQGNSSPETLNDGGLPPHPAAAPAEYADQSFVPRT
jgi:hypothetical protein